jgi:hypothetical protein
MPVITVQSLRKVFTSGVSTRNSILYVYTRLFTYNNQRIPLVSFFPIIFFIVTVLLHLVGTSYSIKILSRFYLNL